MSIPRRRSEQDQALPARQQRSLETVERVLDAAEAILRANGAEGATLRAIAARAGVSSAVVYRRFPDKDTVLRAVYLRFFTSAAESNARSLAAARTMDIPPTVLARRILTGMVSGYEMHRKLLHALILYARTHEDRDFRHRASELNDAAYAGVADLLEERGLASGHPDPRTAIRFALSVTGAAAQEHIVFGRKVSPVPDIEPFVRELTRMFLSYLEAGTT